MADVGGSHVTRVTLFRNGDPNFNGKHIVVNPRYYRNFESFLDTATFSTQCTSAVTRICTPLGRNTIESVNQFSNGGAYVAVGRENFKRLKYGQPKPRKTPLRLPSVWRNQLPSSGRFRKIYEGERQALKRIYVYRNGDNLTPARMILLKKRTLSDMELVLAALQESGMNFDFAISKIFTLHGKQIHYCDEIAHDGKYVALERGSRFKFMNYKGQGGVSPRNAISNVTRLPPIASQNNTHVSVNTSPQKQTAKPTLNKPRPPAKQEKNESSSQPQPKRKQREYKRSVVPTQQSIVSISQDENGESFSNINLSVTPPPLDESPDFTFSAATKAKEPETKDEQLPEIGDIPRDIDELPEKEKELIGAQIYKATGMQREWGEMVTESRAGPAKQIDNDPVEEIVEDITEDIEDVTEISETSKENVEIKQKENHDKERSESEVSKDDDDQSDEEAVEEEEDGPSEAESASKDCDNKKVDADIKPDPVDNDDDQSDEEAVEEEEDGPSEDESASKDGDDKKVDDDRKPDTVDNDDDQIDEVAVEEEEDEASEDGPSEDESASKDGDDKKVDDDRKPADPDAAGNDNDDDNIDGGENLPVAASVDNDDVDDDDNDDDDDDDKVDVVKNLPPAAAAAASADKDNEDDDDDDNKNDEDDNKDNSPTASQNQTRRSSQDMNSEDEVKSEDEIDEEDEGKDDDDEKNDDDDDDDDDDKSEDEDSDEDKDEGDEKDDEQSSAASESENEASEEEDETTQEITTKENKTNQKVEKQRAKPDASIKKDKSNMAKGRSTKTRDVNKA